MKNIEKIILTKLQRGEKLLKKKRYAEALEAFQHALKLDNRSDNAYAGLAVAYFEMDNYPKALEAIVNAILLRHKDIELKRQFLHILQKSGLSSFEPVIANELFKCLQNPLLFTEAVPLARSQLKAKADSLQQIENNDNLFKSKREILLDQMFLDLLFKSINTNIDTETLLTNVRKQILLAYPNSIADIGDLAEIKIFCTGLAHACFNNDYVFYVSPEESKILEQLEQDIITNIKQENLADLEFKLLLYALYNQLSELSCREELLAKDKNVWEPSFYLVLKRTLVNTQIENEIKANLPQLGIISDEISQKVKAQYEEHPYPRWFIATGRSRYKEQLKQYNFTLPEFLNSKLDILVAGAGTGQHPISTATSQSNNKIIAVDISGASLAYGIRMARDNNVTNIDFKQGDLLNVGQLNKKFHIIECAGVLHHMHDPMQGWQALVDVLHDGGLMYVGLYSEAARRDVVKARAKIAELGLTGKDGEIRDFRRQVLNDEYQEIKSVTKWSDFYNLPQCRDLLFHVQEHRFTLPKIQTALDKLGLRFVGMVANETVTENVEKLKDTIPKHLHPSQLKYWEFVEEQLPNTFIHMYHLWLVKV
ncbi:methyltransferase domain-containing protein [Thiotrichales bacterium HSG1]|nr:methyltransferase domain-containing protein [Thiotrichales bacterium HSG1]